MKAMTTRGLLLSAAVLSTTTTQTHAFLAAATRPNSSILRSLTHLLGGSSSSSSSNNANNNKTPGSSPSSLSTRRDGVKRNLFGGLFGGGKGQGIDYSTLKEKSAIEAAEYATQGLVPEKTKDGYSIATFGGGCFWGLELAYQRVPGVIDTSVGYTQGQEDKPNYDSVCSGFSGHTEAVQVFYDPKEVTFDYLCKVLLSRIDPTLKNRVGNDAGTQYRHGIYCHTQEQLKVAEEVLTEAQKQFNRPIVTELKPAMVYWPAEEYHQKYLSKGGRNGRPQDASKGATTPIRCYG